jgi:tetratricopeptide (TPR) repeat protein
VPKPGRNDPCPCGSGKKYKHCCLDKDRAAELASAVAQRVALQDQQATQKAKQVALQKGYQEELLESLAALQESQALDAASNAVVDLVHAGRLDEAEQAARELLVRYPEVHDGHDRLGMVHEARGQFRQAADCYRKVVEFMRADPENYDAAFANSFLELIAKLEDSAAQAERAVNDVDRTG